MEKYQRWSEWRKRDLHVHAPTEYTLIKKDDYKWTSREWKMENFIDELKWLSDIAVLWVADYFSIEWYKEVKKYKDSLSNIKLIIPNLELRITPETRDWKKINLHVLFNTENLSEDKIEQFLYSFIFPQQGHNFTCKKTDLIELWRIFEKKASDEEALKKWLNEFFITYQNFFEKLDEQDDLFRNNVLIWVSNNSEDGASWIKDLSWIRNIIYRWVDFIFSSQESDRTYFLWKWADDEKAIIEKYGSLKPCIHGSDYHWSNRGRVICVPDLNRFCRIKANPTFEWLKQVLYEPEDRVRIQENNPNFDFDKPYFDNIMVKEDIEVYWEDSGIKLKKTEIALNNSLIAIIWWRWTGKSTLIWCINNVFNYNGDFFDDETFGISYAKNNDEAPTFEQYNSWKNNYLDYIYISQWYLKENSDKEKISKYIKDLLSIDVDFSSNIIEKININKENIEKIENWFQETDLEWNQVNNEDFVNTQKEKYEQMLKSIETDKNKKDLVLYTNNVEKISKLQIQINKLEKLLSSINSIKNINEEIQTINLEYNEIEWFKIIWDIDYSTQISTIEENKEILTNKMNTLKSDNDWIKSNFSWYTWDLESLLLNAEVYRKNISKAEEQLQIILDKKNELLWLYEERKWFWELIYNEYRRLKTNIDEWWNNITLTRNSDQKELIEKLLLKKDWGNGIKVEWSVDFDEKKFYKWLLEILDGRTYKKDNDIKEKIHIEDFESWCEYIKNWFEDFVDNPKFIDYFLNLNKRSSYIKVNSNISYRWRALKHLSVGQRGTVLLCLQLATKAFSVPIIFDQPEDDLDNQFIMEELVGIFKELKQYRQIIIVTHNANLVINADAEQVIIAENNDEVLTYRTWSIEDEIIRNKICEILEWWEVAFRKRENKYGLV